MFWSNRIKKERTIMNSKIFSINIRDVGKALLIAVASAVLQFVYQLLKDKGFDLTIADFYQVLNVAVMAALAYLSKNFLTNSDGVTFKGEN